MLKYHFPFVASLWLVVGALAVPSTSSIGSDLTFLFQNDLDWPQATTHNGTILISKPQTNAKALASCKQLNEFFLPTEGIHFQSDIKSLMSFLAFQSNSPSQKFWVASSPAIPCAAISLHGGIQSVRCDTELPAFCSQTAPFRPNTNVDPNPNFHVQVKSKKLTVLGTRDALSFRFIGIPYADPFERFTYSKVFSSEASISALNYGSRCIQSGGGSEDCLFLNIYTPFLPQNSASSRNLKPVMFWIHGGAFTSGEGSDGIFDGGNLASRGDVVVVTINYRLGTQGFMTLLDGRTNGNFGIADQITALQWVQEHIADFGGDPNRVTIFGQSAGAGSVRALLAAKPAFGLFQGAIPQSNLGGFGFASTYSNYFTLEQSFAQFSQPLVQSVGCANASDVLACLRAVPADTIFNAPNSTAESPRFIVVDGHFITTNQLEVTGRGPAAKAHVMFGWMRDDGCDFIGNFPTAGETLQTALLESGFPFNVTQAVVNSKLFPSPNSSNPLEDLFNVTSRVGTDGEFRCIDQATLISAAKHKVFPSIFAYQFDRSYAGFTPIPNTCVPPATAEFPNGDPSLPYFRCHSGELFYMFGTLGQNEQPFRDANDLVMSQVSVDIWASFARSFDPNPDPAFLNARGFTNTTAALSRAGRWEQVTPGNENRTPLRLLDLPLGLSAFQEEEQCALLGIPFDFFE
ncbi:hypothetical protein CVT26_000764 [Gymnopilus dilepis]|uniref:Carboxylic ester hydrolase n=1 Tax=Gymnopilus dilepis TaxID=231916 RepID=A0A409Y2N2_9AGAR|nr:hypothetical protein CVT26_000764 [Gymnopilus dilepis]